MNPMLISEMFRHLWKNVSYNVQKGDRALVITDPTVDPTIIQCILCGVWAAEATPTLVVIPVPNVADDLSEAVRAAVLKSDLVIAAASRSLSRARTIQMARDQGIRYLVMAGMTPELLLSGAITADLDELTAITKKYTAELTKGEVVHVTSAEGTDLTFSIKGRQGLCLDGRMDMISHSAGVPGSEAPIAPVEGTANGVIVVDGAVHEIGMLKEPIVMKVEKGNVVSITGGAQAAQLREVIETQGDANSYNIGEFAFGTNPATNSTGNVQEFKKKLGTIHFALGNNKNLFGDTRCRTHIDCIIKKPTVTIDGKVILDNGNPVI